MQPAPQTTLDLDRLALSHGEGRRLELPIGLGAEDYADEILNTLEVNLSKFIAAVQRGRERLAGRDEPVDRAEVA